MNLNSTLESIQVVAAGAAAATNPKYVSNYTDTYTDPGKEKLGGSKQGSMNGSTAVTAVSAPEADYQTRRITNLTVYNGDSGANTITVQKDVNGTTYEIIKAVLPAGYSLVYDGTGWGVSPFEASASDSKATSNSVVISTNLSTGDSKAASNSALISGNTSRATSNSVIISTNLSTGDSKATSLSVLTSTADSKAVSNSVIISTNLSIGDSKAASNSLLISSNASAILSAHP